MGRFLISVFKFLADVFGHMKLPFGYRNFNTNDTTYNHLVFHYLCLGLFTAMLHNNHHGTTSSKHSFHWYEFDMGGVSSSFLRVSYATTHPMSIAMSQKKVVVGLRSLTTTLSRLSRYLILMLPLWRRRLSNIRLLFSWLRLLRRFTTCPTYTAKCSRC